MPADWITPYTWEEILEFFPLTYDHNAGSLPKNRIARNISDKAAQYGDLLQYGDCWIYGNFMTVNTVTGMSSGTSSTYAVGTCSSSPTTITFSAGTSSGSS